MNHSKSLLAQNEQLCELWEEEQVEPRPHSRLYHLEPIGIGTPLVESLTSYVMRLADAHCVYPRVLMEDEIIPLLSQSYWRGEETQVQIKLSNYWKRSPRLNGTTNSTVDLVQALERLTLYSNLRFLTMLTWQPILPVKKLLRRERAWCPACYKDWRASNQIIYDPLIWTLAVNQICLHHGLQLQTCCPNPKCGRSIPPLTHRSRPGHCPYCLTWLEGPEQYQSLKLSGQESEIGPHQYWIATALGELLATAPSLSTVPSREQITLIMTQYIKVLTQGNKRAFSRLMQVPTTSVHNWLNEVHLPLLESLLQISFLTRVSLVDFLTGKVPEPTISEPEVLKKPYTQQKREPTKQLEESLRREEEKKLAHETIRTTLQAALGSTDGPPYRR